MMTGAPPHGGGIDAAAARFGGTRGDWLDLSTGINPVPYPVADVPADAWTCLPDRAAHAALVDAARRAWSVPDGAAILPAPGSSSLIARIPTLAAAGRVAIPQPTYGEHAVAFAHHGWDVVQDGRAEAFVIVHPNNPDGRIWRDRDVPAAGLPPAGLPTAGPAAASLPAAGLTVIDESFADLMPEASLIARAASPGTLVLKSLGKFWGLAGLRLGFAIGDPGLITALAEALGPWPVSGPALAIGQAALADTGWATATRRRLADDAARLDALMAPHGPLLGGTSLFRLYRCDAGRLHDRLARRHILTRPFDDAPDRLRLGLPGDADGWRRLEAAL